MEKVGIFPSTRCRVESHEIHCVQFEVSSGKVTFFLAFRARFLANLIPLPANLLIPLVSSSLLSELPHSRLFDPLSTSLDNYRSCCCTSTPISCGGAARCRLRFVVRSVSSNLCDGTTSTPKGTTAVFPTAQSGPLDWNIKTRSNSSASARQKR